MGVFIEGLPIQHILDHISQRIDSDGVREIEVHLVLHPEEVKKIRFMEIPTPHGDLIDRQKLLKALEKRWNIEDDSEFARKSVWQEVERNAPTVIESEG